MTDLRLICLLSEAVTGYDAQSLKGLHGNI